MMAKTPILLLTWTLLQAAAFCDSADTCIAVRPCDNAKNIGSLGSTTDKKLSELQTAVDSLIKQTSDLTSKVKEKGGSCIDMATLRLETKAQLTTFGKDLESLKKDVGLKVGFTASLGTSKSVTIGPSKGAQTIVFKNVFFNAGNAYNPVTGIFTAPLKGAFQFTFTTFGWSKYYSGARLVKNGQQQVTTWTPKGTTYMTSGTAILPLNAGDKVNVMTWGPNNQVFDNQNHHTTFSGFLLFPL